MQVLFCGFGAVGSEMKSFYKWGLYANPTFFVMNALFVAEFKGEIQKTFKVFDFCMHCCYVQLFFKLGNDDASDPFVNTPLGADFDSLSALYGWTFSMLASMLLIVAHSLGYKMLTLLALSYVNFNKS